MRLSYDSKNKFVMIEGQEDIIIPKETCFNIDSTSLEKLEKEYGIRLGICGFQFNGKPSISDKIKMIFKIIKMK